MKTTTEDCFIIMPISDCVGYETGHFTHVYNNIIKPSVINAGFSPTRADEEKSTDLIQLSILKKLIEAPIAICDLSARNPNVLFELGIRQAFDKPVVLIREKGTPEIFDIAPLRYFEYSKEMKYHDVLAFQKELTDAIKETKNASVDGSVNSIVKLLALNSPAAIPELAGSDKNALSLDVLVSEMSDLKRMMREVVQINKNNESLYIKSDSDCFCGEHVESINFKRPNSKNENIRYLNIFEEPFTTSEATQNKEHKLSFKKIRIK